MAILTVEGLSKYWGVDLLFKSVSFLLNEGEKVALVGRNGSGKTTLLKLLMGKMEHDDGRIIMPSGTKIGYLSQDPDFTPGNTLVDEAQSIFGHLKKWERDLRLLEERMGTASNDEALQIVMDEYARVTANFEAAGGYDAHARVKAVLFGLGFAELDLAKPVEVLSGGQKVRLGLAKLLLEAPDLMLLDEPTNHLDLEAVEWLEGYFKGMKSAAILVSHDRYFLDQVITRTVEMANQTCEIYYGHYSYYLDEKKRRLEAAMSAFERQQKEIDRVQFFIKKFEKSANRASQAKSREKMLERMEILERPKAQEKSMKLNFALDYQTGNDVLKVEKLGMAYGEKPVFSGVNLELFKGDRVALVGPNGAGKSTFLKIVQGIIEPTSGSFLWGVGVQPGYFSQDLDDLDHTRTALAEMLEIPGFTKFDAYSLLGRFLFSGEDALKRIAQCSGGERNRLILAKLMVTGSNVLLLDEPTNHLDLESKTVLEESMQDFPGTVLFVSHDRFFVDQVATKIWEFSAAGVTAYEGNYSAYKAEKERLAQMALGADGPPERTGSSPSKGGTEMAKGIAVKEAPTQQATAGDDAHRSRRDERKAVEAARKLELLIAQLELRKTELEKRMSDPDIYRTASGREAVAEYNATQSELERRYAEWEQLIS